MSNMIIRIASITLSLLAVIELLPIPEPWLPLGGSNATQMAIVLGLAFAAAEIMDMWRGH